MYVHCVFVAGRPYTGTFYFRSRREVPEKGTLTLIEFISWNLQYASANPNRAVRTVGRPKRFGRAGLGTLNPERSVRSVGRAG